MTPTPENINYKEFPILYVDDLKDNLKNFKRIYEENFKIFLVNSAQQALELLKEEYITLVLADQRMPSMTGVDFFKIIKDKYPNIIRILITAYSDMDAVIEAINKGNVYGYIGKDTSEEDVKEKIKKGIYTYYLVKERDRIFQEKLDATKKLAMANRINVITSMAEGFADRLGNYIIAINHFFNTFPEQLENLKEELGNEIKEVLKTLYAPSSGASKMSKLTEEIRNLYKPPKYDFKKEKGKVIIDIVDELTETLRSDMRGKNIKIAKALEDNLPAVYFDRDTAKQVLYHLLRNAIQAIPETIEGSILVKVTGPIQKSGRELLRIIVQDNGAGIAEKNIEKIFNPFFTTKGTSGGLGLGLMTCQFIIAQHEGEIELAETEVGKGTIFHVDLPVKLEPPPMLPDFEEIRKQFPNRRN